MSSPLGTPGAPKSLPLILARELASNLATPMFLLDAGGMLVFYNDAAAMLLGKPFAELGEIPSGEFGESLKLAAPSGEPIRRRDSPSGIAFFDHRPAHQTVVATSYDGAPHVRSDRVSVARRVRRDARRRRGVLGGRARGTRKLMRARVWGCRGSVAAPGADTVKYGGNTSCVEVRLESGHALVLDAGTGMRPLGVAMQAELPAELHIMLTHLHLDHLQGLGFFRPLFAPGLDIHIWGPTSPVQHLAERIAMYLSPPLFPVRLEDVPAHLTFHDAPEESVTIGSATIRAAMVTTRGRRSVTASRSTAASSCTCPTMSHHLVPISPPCRWHG